MGWLAPVVAAASNIIGGIMGNNSADKANKLAARESAANRKLQLDTLQNQIQWRVADAQKAGISPLAALGASLGMYQPVSTNFASKDYGFIGDLGQDISRAITAGQTSRERQANAVIAAKQNALAMEERSIQLENGRLQNEYLRSQIARLNSAQVGPGNGDIRQEGAPGGLPPGSVLDQPSSVVVGSRDEPARQPGNITDYQFAATSGGRFSIVPSADMKQRIEDTPQEWVWMLRNGIIPSDEIFRSLETQHPSRPGYEWRYDPFQGQFWQRSLGNRRRHY